MPELVLLTEEGDQVPLTPLVETFGSTGTVPPSQIAIEVPNENEGIVFAATVTVNVTGNAHKPVAGENV